MSERVTKVRVFVSSPGDVEQERDSLTNVVSELNNTIGQPLGFVIDLLLWETHCHPEMGRPQAIINKQIGKYDIFVGIMWKRFGTPTGVAESGTEEEFNLAYEEWQRDNTLHLAFYFSQAKYKLASAEEIDQAGKTLEFQNELSKKGLTWKYSSAETFADTVRPHLAKILFEMFQKSVAAERPKGILGTLRQVQEELDKASAHHRLVVNSAGEFTVRPKHPKAQEEEPLKISARLEFPNTAEGREMRDKLERSLATGEIVTIPKEYIKYVKLPDVFSSLVSTTGDGTESLTIGGVVPVRVILFDLVLRPADGDKIALENIVFETSRPSVDKIVLSNEKQLLPWKFTLTLNLVEGTLLFDYKVDYRGLTAKRELDAMQFTDAFSKGGTLDIVHVDSGFTFQTVQVVPGIIPATDSNLLRLIERAAYIQNKVRVPIVIPEASAGEQDAISAEDANRVIETAQKIETGRAILDVEHWENEVNLDLATKLLDLFEKGEPQSLSFSVDDEVVSIFGTDVHLGMLVLTCERTVMANEDVKSLKEAVAANHTSIHVRFMPLEGTPMLAHYPAWLPSDEGQMLLRQMSVAKGQSTNKE
jgi:hypothetical protein